MKIYFSADLHAGNYGKNGGRMVNGMNQRCRDSLAAFEWLAAQGASDVGRPAHVHLGDFLDYANMEPPVLTEIQNIILSSEMDHHFLSGNHDQSSTGHHDNGLGPLSPVATVVEVTDSWLSLDDAVDICLIPFRPEPASEWLSSVLADVRKFERKYKILCIHLGISDSRTPYYLDGSADAISLQTLSELALEHGFTHVFAGNWHKHEWWTCDDDDGNVLEVVQVGTLAPNRFTDTRGRYGCMAVFDTDNGSIKIVDVPGPRFIKTLDYAELLAFLEDPGDAIRGGLDYAKPLYVSATVLASQVDGAKEQLADAQQGPLKDILRNWEVHRDSKEQARYTNAAVAAATEAASPDTAIVGYVGAMDLPDVVARADVQKFVQDCIRDVPHES